MGVTPRTPNPHTYEKSQDTCASRNLVIVVHRLMGLRRLDLQHIRGQLRLDLGREVEFPRRAAHLRVRAVGLERHHLIRTNPQQADDTGCSGQHGLERHIRRGADPQ